MHLAHRCDIVHFTCTVARERTNVVEMEYFAIRYGMTCCEADSTVLLKNSLLLSVVELSFKGDRHELAP